MVVGLGPGDTVLDGDPAPPKRSMAPNFWAMSVVANGRPSQSYDLLSEVLQMVKCYRMV